MLPTSVEIVIGDVGDPSSLKVAVKGCNKIIYCATARTSITGDLNRVDYQGVSNLTKAFQDYNNKLAQLRAGKSSKSKLLLAKFKSADSLNGWVVRQGTYFQDAVPAKYDGATGVWMLNLKSLKVEMQFSQVMFSPEEDTWNYQKSFRFLWIALLTGEDTIFKFPTSESG